MGAKHDRTLIQTAAEELIKALRDRIERPTQQTILALERVAKLNPGDPEVEGLCVKKLREAAAGIRQVNLNGLVSQFYELERNLTRVAGKGAK